MAYIEPLDPFQKARLSHLYLEYGTLEVCDGAFVLTDALGVRVQIPLGAVSTLFLEPGITVTHAAVCLAGSSGTQLIWTGAGATRTYSVGRPAAGDVQRLLHQARCYCEDSSRLVVVRNMYKLRFGEAPPERRSIEQLRGIEGSRVRAIYQGLANKYRVSWTGRKYDPKDWDSGDLVNRGLSAGNACLHGLCEAVILACGYSPSIGFIHTGDAKSFVFDIADLYKMDVSVPLAFKLAAQNCAHIEREIRSQLRDLFRQDHVVERIVSDTDTVLEVGS